MTTKEVPIEIQIAAVRREIALRKKLFPEFIERKKISEADAAKEIAAMEAVHATLTDVQTLRNAGSTLDVLPAGELERVRTRILGK